MKVEGQKAILPAWIVSAIADEYQKRKIYAKESRDNIESKIKKLQEEHASLFNCPIYEWLYKPEYGDYRNYVEAVANELRRRNTCSQFLQTELKT